MFFNSTFQYGRCSEQNFFASVTSFRLHCGVRQKEAQTLGNGTKKRTAKTVPFVALTWCQASKIGLPVGTRKDALRCFSIQPFNADGVASKTHFASVTLFRFHCGVRPKEAQTLGNGTKKRTAKTVLFVAVT